MNKTPILKIENLSHVYSEGTPFELAAIEDVNIEIQRGEIIGIIGHTGSGKSTLIQHLNALIKPTGGKVYFNGRDINESKQSVREVRSKVGLVFQYPEYQLFEETVFKDIAFGPKNMGLTPDEIDVRVRASAGFVGIDEELLERSPFDLSGGQKRRIAIAGVIAMLPEVLILDEPMAGLDPAGRRDIMDNLMGYHKETGAAILIVTHSMEEAARHAQRMIVMNGGHVAMDGTPEEVFSHGKELSAMGLAVPEMTVLADRLRDMGVKLPESIYTVEQMKNALLALKGGALDA
ncbi:MAG: energy-coupling factor transporter ATPase [Oscillospiraceae bacterium]